jgi:hypothetical protein
MDLRRLRFAISQIGVTASRHLPDPGGMIVALEDLPSGWKVVDERRWRSGVGQERWAVRVRELGGLTAWRSFKAPSNDRWLWAQATPLADGQDAEAAQRDFWERRMKNLAAQVSVTETREGPPLILPASIVRTVEELTEGRAGTGAARYLVWTNGRVVSALGASALAQPWSWERLEEIALKQNQRIDAVISR